MLKAVDSALETSYERSKGPKTLHRLVTSGASSYFDVNRALLNYELILAVDTNTKRINEVDVSVAAIVQCFLERPAQIGRMTGSYSARLALEYENVTNPELVGWRETIRLILASPTYRNGQTVALIVDSELGRLRDVNARRLPIIDDFYLPVGFTLVYASADTGKESIPNRLIAFCDREAGRVLGLAALNPNPRRVGSRPVDRPSRIWNVADIPKP